MTGTIDVFLEQDFSSIVNHSFVHSDSAMGCFRPGSIRSGNERGRFGTGYIDIVSY